MVNRDGNQNGELIHDQTSPGVPVMQKLKSEKRPSAARRLEFPQKTPKYCRQSTSFCASKSRNTKQAPLRKSPSNNDGDEMSGGFWGCETSPVYYTQM